MELSDRTNRLMESAIDRYGWHPWVLVDATNVGRVLCGDADTVETMTVGVECGAFVDCGDPCLWSLLESLIDWHRHTVAGTIPARVPPVTPPGEAIPMRDAESYLRLLGMWGEGGEYEHPSQVSDAGRDFLGIAPVLTLLGWTTWRLAELYALGYVAAELETMEDGIK